MFEKKKLLKYIVFFGTIFLIFYLKELYFDVKLAKNMSHVYLSISSKSNINNVFKVYMISQKGNVKSFLKDENNKNYYINFGAYINKIKIIVDSNKTSEINVLQFKIGDKYYELNNDDLINRWKEENNKSVIFLDINDFIGIKRSIIPIFNKIINWPGFYSYFSIKYLILIFIILVSIGTIIFFIEILLKKYFPFLFDNQSINRILTFFILIIIFNITYFQKPMYRANQHTKFLHGLAKAGYGYLDKDWLANTVDPLPAFSFIVSITSKYLHFYFFYLYQAILYGIFICSILLMSFKLFNIEDKKIKILTLSTVIILFHSQFFYSISNKIFGFGLLGLFYEYGVADQRLLGNYLQPSVFGVFILLSIYYFLKNKPYTAVILSAIASIFHSAYIIFSGLLTLSYIIIILKDEKNLKKAFLVGLLSFVLVSPVLIYNMLYLNSTSKEDIKIAYDIIVNKRIPVHTDPRLWIDFSVYIKVIMIALATFIVRKKKVFLMLLLPFLFGIILTIVKLFTNSNLIGFLIPWRVSVFLVPLSATIILAFTIEYIFKKFENYIYKKEFLVKMICYIVILMPLLFGLNRYIKDFRNYLNKNINPLESFVLKNKSPNDNYFIPVDYKEFRLNTGVPIFVTSRSHPYKDIEVIEWYKRVAISEDFYSTPNNDKCKMILLLKRNYGITHVVLLKNQFDWNLECLEELYRDSNNGVYRIKE